ncbi:J domain-containing protein [Chloroflexi bacterium TSY]|nr:J domain-containing protein [Chloroflexi bacterium TSY]
MDLQKYYKILDVPEGTPAPEIKARYRQLVRIFHPDNFTDSTDKEFAERRLQEIVGAYHTILQAPSNVSVNSSSVIAANKPSNAFHLKKRKLLSQLIAFPAKLDYGIVPHNEKQDQTLYVIHAGEKAKSVEIVCDQKSE